jgi:hypothetical protein
LDETLITSTMASCHGVGLAQGRVPCHHETDKAHRPAFRLAARRNDSLSAQAHLRLDELLGFANIHDFAVRTPCNDEGRGFYELGKRLEKRRISHRRGGQRGYGKGDESFGEHTNSRRDHHSPP